MPGDNGVRFNDYKDLFPCRPKPAEQNPESPILDAELRARLLSLEHTQLLPEGYDLQAEVVAGTEKGAHTGEQADEKWNHEPGFIA